MSVMRSPMTASVTTALTPARVFATMPTAPFDSGWVAHRGEPRAVRCDVFGHVTSADDQGGTPARQAGVDPEDRVGMENVDQGIEVSRPGRREERGSNPALGGEVGVGYRLGAP